MKTLNYIKHIFLKHIELSESDLNGNQTNNKTITICIVFFASFFSIYNLYNETISNFIIYGFGLLNISYLLIVIFSFLSFYMVYNNFNKNKENSLQIVTNIQIYNHFRKILYSSGYIFLNYFFIGFLLYFYIKYNSFFNRDILENQNQLTIELYNIIVALYRTILNFFVFYYVNLSLYIVTSFHLYIDKIFKILNNK